MKPPVKDREEAVRLHVWNTAVSAAFYGPLQVLEVALRNAMNRRLGGRYGAAWYDNDCAGLNNGALDWIRSAKAELQQDGHGNDPHQVVAALSFGFWVSLLGRGGPGPTTRGRSGARRCATPSPHRRNRLIRRQAHRPLNALRTLRNRIAHHEPIFLRNLAEDHERILEVAGWISPVTRAWIEHHSRVPVALETARDDSDIRF